ncbi:anchored repeat ABC transporter, substrate-binding protein [Helcobacillus massiliensis]|uniref:anchored repeat ABC transporter, substrate-binding protein n=1 Tax=Helcobacillus massiliensis TaxID=521392 RepID=UPI002555C230|nr:anchored repeat ABC transporter, substrate-binding protein [Helcobacillus massiliensis]MDK7743069.1 anchored repeat ABC transporter, substrate-binding protein [Helcobacillus massiliensis]
MSTPLTRRRLTRRTMLGAGAAGALTAAIALPGRSSGTVDAHGLSIITTTGILADLARRVVGADGRVTSLVPEGGDPHSYEPTPRAVRDVAHADLALSNYLMLEEQSLIRMIDANLAPGVRHLALAEEASQHGAEVIPLVESRSLDTVWLGLRVSGAPGGDATADGSAAGGADGKRPADRLATTRLSLIGADGPGDLHGYITGTFGQPQSVFDSSDGAGARSDAIDLSLDAHTHMSWAFTEPGVYRARFAAVFTGGSVGGAVRAEGELVIAAGTDPSTIPGREGARIIDAGHADLTADLTGQRLVLRVDAPTGSADRATGGDRGADGAAPAGSAAHATEDLPLDSVVVHVPPKALLPIPSDPAFRFIGRPGTDVYQLPQAVLGRHVHGEIDPHLWQDVTNAQAYVEVIRDAAVGLDPEHAAAHRARAAEYLRELDEVDAYVQRSIDSIPQRRRHLVTTHDAYGYLAHRYGLDIAGTVSPSPGQEPSIADRRRLATTLRDLAVPAVFIEQGAGPASRSLRDAAEIAGVEVRPIWGDALTPGVRTYADMMRANADSLARGLGGTPLGTHDLSD